jgi:hypothetical protein
MQIDEKILFDCSVFHTSNHVPMEDLFDYHCKNCGAAAWQIKPDRKEQLVKEIDAAVEKMDSAIGRVMYGVMDAEEASNWIEHEAETITDTLDKAREHIKDMNEENKLFKENEMLD